MANNNPASGGQFPPVIPTQQPQPFAPMTHQQYRHLGPGMQPGQNQLMQFSQPIQQMQHWPGQQMPYGQPNRPPPTLGAPHLQQAGPPAGGVPYQFVPSAYGQQQNTPQTLSHFPPMSQMAAPVGGQPWLASGGHSGATTTPVQESGHQSSGTPIDPAAADPSPSQQSASDWQEHTASDGRRYYYNRRTRQSSWEKPSELMTPMERADASTAWKEFTTPEGRTYYYNKFTKQSKWTIPEELELAREQAQQTVNQGAHSENNAANHTSAATAATLGETPVGLASGPVPVTPVVSVATPSVVVSASSTIPVTNSSTLGDAGANHLPAAATMSADVPTAPVNSKTDSLSGVHNVSSPVATNHVDGTRDAEESKKGILADGKQNAASSDEKVPEDEPLLYTNKQEAKNAFKALLESANIQSDRTWEQAMKEIVNDKRYGALKTLGERKQAFNEYLGQRKKIEAEERRVRQKKAREEFTRMLEESKELTSSMKWSKAVNLFENDDRFKAVEKVRDREELFDAYMLELQRKEKEKAAEDHKRHIAEFRKFLESCDFIKASTQWRRIQDRLEDDERCLRLEKLDRLLTFQDYIRDLEKEEEDQKKLHKEQLRRAERKARDAFRELLEEHVSAGVLTAKTRWFDYCAKVKDSPQYLAVASNTSGSKPKDLFEDVFEELEKHYHDDKTLLKDAMKSKNIVVLSAWTFDDFKASIADDVGSQHISEINLKLLFEEFVDRAKEKEEKEAKKRQRLADDFTELLYTYKEVTASTSWEECKPLIEESQEFKSFAEESLAREVFEDYVAHLQEKAKEKERKREEEKAKKEKDREEKEKRKEKEKEKKEKERDREREKGKERTKKDELDNENGDTTETYSHKDDRKKEKDKDRKHRKRHQGADEEFSDKDDKEESKKSRRHGSDRKRSKKSYSSESDSESRHKKHKRDHRDSSRKAAGEELEDGEVGEDGEIRVVG